MMDRQFQTTSKGAYSVRDEQASVHGLRSGCAAVRLRAAESPEDSAGACRASAESRPLSPAPHELHEPRPGDSGSDGALSGAPQRRARSAGHARPGTLGRACPALGPPSVPP
jgi:hypothetical protein